MLNDIMQVRIKKLVAHPVLANIGWLIGDRILRMGASLVIGVQIARYLGADQYGVMNFAIAICGILGSLASLGLEGIVVREIVRDPINHKEILGSTFGMKFVAAIVAGVIAFSVIELIRPNDELIALLIAITSLALIMNQITETLDFWFQSHVQSKYVVWARNFGFWLTAGLKLILLWQKASVVAFLVASLIESLLIATYLGWVYGRKIWRWQIRWQRCKALLKDSLPLLVSSAMIMIYMRIDQIMLAQMISDAELGVYSVAVRFAEVWYFVPMALASSTLPGIMKLATDTEVFFQRLQHLYNSMAALSYAIAISMTLVAPWLIHLLFDAEYARATNMLIVLTWSLIFTSLGVARSSFLTAMNWQKVHLATTTAGCIVNIVLNYVLIPIHGGLGAAIASFIAYAIAAYGSCFLYKPLWGTAKMLTKAMIFPKFW
jgi:O-antigen/teichoic acid export membrane protein